MQNSPETLNTYVTPGTDYEILNTEEKIIKEYLR